MPLRSVMLTPDPITSAELGSAAQHVWRHLRKNKIRLPKFQLIFVEDASALQVYSDEELFLTMLRPIVVSHVEEVERLIPRAQTDDLQFPVVWTTALTPYTRTGYVGLGILSRMMELREGTVIHAQLPPVASEYT